MQYLKIFFTYSLRDINKQGHPWGQGWPCKGVPLPKVLCTFGLSETGRFHYQPQPVHMGIPLYWLRFEAAIKWLVDGMWMVPRKAVILCSKGFPNIFFRGIATIFRHSSRVRGISPIICRSSVKRLDFF